MAFYGRSNRAFIEADFASGEFLDHQVVHCDLEGTRVTDTLLRGADFREIQASGIVFDRDDLIDNSFTMCTLSQSSFSFCTFDNTEFEGINFIKTRWNDCRSHNSTIRGSLLHRLHFEKSGFSGCVFSDLEALNGTIRDCVFSGCTFEIGFGSGVNGFGETLFSRCIFQGCSFDGAPLRGAKLDHCIFMNCGGDIGDNMEAAAVAGIGHPAFWHQDKKEVTDRRKAEELLERIAAITSTRN